MVLLDENPILWHLMKIYSVQGFDNFIVACGYRGEVIQEWIENLQTSWIVQAQDTGQETQTGGRIKKVMQTLPGERVMVTYGDGLGNINIKKLLEFHNSHGRLATVTAVRPPARFGVLEMVGNKVTHFGEKNHTDAGWINGGFFVLEPEILKLINKDSDNFESDILPNLTLQRELMAYQHQGFWQPMDTLREKNELVKYASQDPPPWLQNLN